MLPNVKSTPYCAVMTQPNWSGHLVRSIAGEIKRWRTARDMSAQQLADACAKLGHPIPRSVLANIESGRREAISVPELLVLARALRVTPLRLLVPLGHEEMVDIAPGVRTPTTWALYWLRGDSASPTNDEPGDATVHDFVAHDQELSRWSWAADLAASIRAGEMEGTDQEVERYEADAERARMNLQTIRRAMRSRGELPPPTPPNLRLDEGRPS
ncbi:helix-turn-helix domain-containing protein [Micromonospora sp. IBHARD004]|uniref:helix-turn-helix domain-containing protein n=1 Tax=Micromonospora sp. IBHARD004 TaxID=3457764 RepID=UPI004059A400